MTDAPQAVVFDVGKVLFEWDLRHLYAKLIDDTDELDWFLANVVTTEWHFRHDAGHALEESVPELKARFPEHAELIDAYAPRCGFDVVRTIVDEEQRFGRIAEASLRDLVDARIGLHALLVA